jgi:copper chaperone CopZ
VRVSLKAVPGVDTVNVSLEKGLATVTLKPGNTTTMKQIQDAITRNGFTMKGSKATVFGTVTDTGSGFVLRVGGSNDVLRLQPTGNETSQQFFTGKSVRVVGMIPEAPKGKTAAEIRYNTIEEQP